MKTRITHGNNPSPAPHVSGGVLIDGWLYVSGQGPLDMFSKKVVPGTIEEETRLTLDNLHEILRRSELGLGDVVKCTCFLADLADFPGFDATYREYFSGDVPPARSTVRADLLQGIKIEIEAVARHASASA